MIGSENVGGGSHTSDLFDIIIAKKNIFAAWREFKNGKTNKADVAAFAEYAECELIGLHEDLARGAYRHGAYARFFVHDPKRRPIAKASVRDRVLHHAICRALAPRLDQAFIFDSYSSRMRKGTHAANDRLSNFAKKLSQNGTKTVWLLKCDIRKFFDSVDHDVLLGLCRAKIEDPRVLDLLENIISSFETRPCKGIPLGNLTSQLFANLYLDSLDNHVKRTLRVKHYIRYTDDFVFLSRDRKELERLLPQVTDFLRDHLLLDMHPDKVIFRRWHEGVDFLGFVHFPHFSVVRPKTVRRMFRKLAKRLREIGDDEQDRARLEQSKQSYLGVLSHGRSKCLARAIRHGFRLFSVRSTSTGRRF